MKKEKIVALVLTVAVGISTSPFGNLVSLAENEPDYLPEYPDASFRLPFPYGRYTILLPFMTPQFSQF